MTALLLAAAFACGAALPAMAKQATPETAAQPDPTEWADEAQDVTEAEEAPVYQQADAQEVATGETAASLTVTAADCTAQFIDEAYRLFLPVNTDMAALTIETGAELAAADAEGLTVDGTTVSGDFTNIETPEPDLYGWQSGAGGTVQIPAAQRILYPERCDPG